MSRHTLGVECIASLRMPHMTTTDPCFARGRGGGYGRPNKKGNRRIPEQGAKRKSKGILRSRRTGKYPVIEGLGCDLLPECW